MSTEIDLKELWSKGASNDIPDINRLLKKAAGLRKGARLKLIIQTVTLVATVIVMLYAAFMIPHPWLTTKIGFALTIAGVVSYLLTTNQLLPMLFKGDIGTSSQAYLNQLIRIKRNNELLRKVMIDVYFGLLLTGMWLYLIQSSKWMSTLGAILIYLVPSVFLAMAWVSAKRHLLRKNGGLDETIKKLELVNQQLLDNAAE